ncbi:MAG: serine acetyltransferase [Spirochaetaceae bacterium]|jgi:serine O-acetyltransferase|nr:serine acetyltransferase [Spirochaetaceae bacterium]
MENFLDCRRKHIVEALVENYKDLGDMDKAITGFQINRSVMYEVIDNLRELIFPGYFGKKNLNAGFIEYHVGELVEEIEYSLTVQIERALRHREKKYENPYFPETASAIVFAFLSKLPDIRKILQTDIEATFDGDPAAFSRDEIISSYPGVYAIMVYRLAHELYILNVPLIPRIMTERAHSITGIDIHPGAKIGAYFFIDHGTGVVIGETTVIGKNAKIYQGVTLGGLSTRGGQSLKSVKRHPTIEDNVTIYSGASILGGETVIGEGAIIGSNAFITKTVPPYTKVSIKNPELQFRNSGADGTATTELLQDGFWDYVI